MQQPSFKLGRKLQEGRVEVKFMALQTWLLTTARECPPSLSPRPLVLPAVPTEREEQIARQINTTTK